MVTRKPVAQPADADLDPSPDNPPYPVTPISTDIPAQFRMQDVRGQMGTSATDSEPNSANVWSGEGLDRKDTAAAAAKVQLSESLRAGGGHHTGRPDLPDSLRAGPPPGYTPKSSQERLAEAGVTTNPFLRRQQTGHSDTKERSSTEAWGERPDQPLSAPPPPPQQDPPTQHFSNLSVSEPSTNPWQPALEQQASTATSHIPLMPREDSGNDAWATPPDRQATGAAPSETSQQPVLIDIAEPESPAWDEDEPSPVLQETPANERKKAPQINEDRNVWDETQGEGSRQNAAATTPFVAQPDPTQQTDGWNLIDHDPTATDRQESGVVGSDGTVLQTFPIQESEHAPALPPRRSHEVPPPQPPRPTLDTADTNTSSIASPAIAAVRKQKKETYEIKKVSWHDANSASNPRISPILVQNANGPCPLLALVNALTLSTPANEQTALIETLRSREQVSLGLLLDAVFDELMSGRRGDAAQELPDVSDLYAFLITLHTGMNVNPRFCPLPATSSPIDPRNSMSHVHPTEREATMPGTFEDTREMKLYSTFSIPLIHGWLPERDSSALAALSRSAQSYEDAQNLMFNEEVLEDKLQREGLSFQEQGTLEDISTIKAFFATNATQLTTYGLQTITNFLTPGAVAILFRNDHFSTLYRHPYTLQLLQLVTDLGYAGHEEVVWESLIDVNGENAEFFSGDFRLVGGAPASPSIANISHPSCNGWTAVPGHRTSSNQNQQEATQNSQNAPVTHDEPPQSPSTEQEDHDLALALQLQEEEEERHRNETARRQRETELSQQFIEQQGRGGMNIPVSQRGGRGRSSISRGGGAPELRPAIPPRRSGTAPTERPTNPEAGVEAPPPSYEQAANQAAYIPSTDHPAHSNASPIANRGRRMSAYSANASAFPGNHGGPPGRMSRRGTGPTLIDQIPGRRPANSGSSSAQPQNKDRDCVLM